MARLTSLFKLLAAATVIATAQAFEPCVDDVDICGWELQQLGMWIPKYTIHGDDILTSCHQATTTSGSPGPREMRDKTPGSVPTCTTASTTATMAAKPSFGAHGAEEGANATRSPVQTSRHNARTSRFGLAVARNLTLESKRLHGVPTGS